MDSGPIEANWIYLEDTVTFKQESGRISTPALAQGLNSELRLSDCSTLYLFFWSDASFVGLLSVSLIFSRDSFYEYLIKAATFFNDEEYYKLWHSAYQAVEEYLRIAPWYVEVRMATAQIAWPYFHSKC